MINKEIQVKVRVSYEPFNCQKGTKWEGSGTHSEEVHGLSEGLMVSRTPSLAAQDLPLKIGAAFTILLASSTFQQLIDAAVGQ